MVISRPQWRCPPCPYGRHDGCRSIILFWYERFLCFLLCCHGWKCVCRMLGHSIGLVWYRLQDRNGDALRVRRSKCLVVVYGQIVFPIICVCIHCGKCVAGHFSVGHFDHEKKIVFVQQQVVSIRQRCRLVHKKHLQSSITIDETIPVFWELSSFRTLLLLL